MWFNLLFRSCGHHIKFIMVTKCDYRINTKSFHLFPSKEDLKENLIKTYFVYVKIYTKKKI